MHEQREKPPEKEVASIIFEFDEQGFGHRVRMQGQIPHAAIVNALELLKVQMLMAQLTQMGQDAARKMAKGIVLPNGPIR